MVSFDTFKPFQGYEDETRLTQITEHTCFITVVKQCWAGARPTNGISIKFDQN